MSRKTSKWKEVRNNLAELQLKLDQSNRRNEEMMQKIDAITMRQEAAFLKNESTNVPKDSIKAKFWHKPLFFIISGIIFLFWNIVEPISFILTISWRELFRKFESDWNRYSSDLRNAKSGSTLKKRIQLFIRSSFGGSAPRGRDSP